MKLAKEKKHWQNFVAKNLQTHYKHDWSKGFKYDIVYVTAVARKLPGTLRTNIPKACTPWKINHLYVWLLIHVSFQARKEAWLEGFGLPPETMFSETVQVQVDCQCRKGITEKWKAEIIRIKLNVLRTLVRVTKIVWGTGYPFRILDDRGDGTSLDFLFQFRPTVDQTYWSFDDFFA